MSDSEKTPVLQTRSGYKGKKKEHCPECDTEVEHQDAGGMTVCPRCGWVGEEGSLRMDIELAEQPVGNARGGTSYGPTGTLVKASETGGGIGSTDQSGAVPSVGALRRPRVEGSREALAKREAFQKLSRIISALHLNTAESEEARSLLRKAMEGRWRCGRWAELMVASVAYVVCRQNSKSYTLLDVADVVQCNVFTLGRVYTRLVQEMSLQLPHVDPSLFIERACGTLQLGDKARTVSEHAMALVKLAQGDWLVTGRRPEAVAAASILLACEANDVILEDGLRTLANMLHVGLKTVQERQRELGKAALDLAKSLPWGKDVTRHTLHTFLPFVLSHLDYAIHSKNEGQQKKAVVEEPPRTNPPAFRNAHTVRYRRGLRIRKAQMRLGKLLGVQFKEDGDLWVELGLESLEQDDGHTEEGDLQIERQLLKGVSATKLLDET